MNNSVTYSLDVLKSLENSEFLVEESLKDSLDTDSVVLDRHFLYKGFLSCGLMLEASCLHTDSLYNTFGKEIVYLIVLHIKKLILKR